MSSNSFTDSKPCDLTHEKLLEALSVINSYKYPTFPKETKTSWYEKKMNKLGWYRQTTVYVIDSSKFNIFNPMEKLK